jgi:hypothetical protein
MERLCGRSGGDVAHMAGERSDVKIHAHGSTGFETEGRVPRSVGGARRSQGWRCQAARRNSRIETGKSRARTGSKDRPGLVCRESRRRTAVDMRMTAAVGRMPRMITAIPMIGIMIHRGVVMPIVRM